MGNALRPNKAFSPVGTGTSPFAARFDDTRLGVSELDPQNSPGAIKPTVNMTAITSHVAAAATPGSYADLPAVVTDVTALRASIETALGAHDTALTTLRSEAEARLDAIETKLDALIVALILAGVLET